MSGTYSKQTQGRDLATGAVGTYSNIIPGLVDTPPVVPGVYSHSFYFDNGTNNTQTFNSASYVDITGMSDASMNLESGKSYGIWINGKFNPNSVVAQFELAIEFGNGQVVSLGNVRYGTSSAGWEQFNLGANFTANASHTTSKLKLRRDSGSGTCHLQATNRKFGVYIFEFTGNAGSEVLGDFTVPTTTTIPSATYVNDQVPDYDYNWRSGITDQTIDLTIGQEYGVFMGLAVRQATGAPELTTRVNFNNDGEYLQWYDRTQSTTRQLNWCALENITPAANLTAWRPTFAVQTFVGTGEFNAGVRQLLYAVPTSTDEATYCTSLNYVKGAGNQTISDGTIVDISGMSNQTIDLKSGNNYVCMMAFRYGSSGSGAHDLQMILNLNDGAQEVAMNIFERESGDGTYDYFGLVTPFTAGQDSTNLKIAARLAYEGGLNALFEPGMECHLIIKKVN